jgi:hypothetical protein
MAGTIIVDTINSSVASTPPVFQANGTQIGTLCRAWVNFNGTGTVAIRASFNVTSITDNGTGDYTVNFTTAMPDANYSVSISGRQIAASNLYSSAVKTGTTPTASAVNIVSIAATGNAGDSDFIYVAIFR